MAWTPFASPSARCRACGLSHVATGCVCIQGTGPVEAALVFVGEGPGEEEEYQGFPFVGRAGQFLTKCIRAAGLMRSEVFITNTVRCRPPHPITGKNRKPTHHEIDACHGYLDDELALVKPKVIVAMGDTAMFAVLGERIGGVLDSRGRVIWSERYNAWVVCTYHPAYLLRKPAEEFFFIQDIIRAKTVAEHGRPSEPSPVDYRVIQTLDDAFALRDYLLDHEEVFYDWETNGVHLTKSEGFCCSFAVQPNEAFVLPRYGQDHTDLWTPDELRTIDAEVFAPLFMSHIRWGGHHIAFDNCITKTTIGVWPRHVGFCSMIANHAVNNHLGERAHGLKILADLLTDMGRYDDPLDKWLLANFPAVEGKPDMGQVWRAPNDLVWRYNAADADASCRIAPLLIAQMTERGVYENFKDERMRLVVAHQEIDREGVRIDTVYLEELSGNLASSLQQITDAIEVEVGHKVNPNSHPQVGYLLFGDGLLPKAIKADIPDFTTIGLPVVSRTESGAPSTREEVLLQFREAHTVVDLILRFRALAKIKGTYVDGTKEDGRKRAIRAVLDEDGRARLNTRIHGTETFRFVTRKPFAIHTFPKNDDKKHPSVRALVIPDDGYRFCSIDYVQQEFAIQAILAEQWDVVEAMLIRGEDIHERVMWDLGKISKTQFQNADGAWLSHDHQNDYKIVRSKYKATNFMILYRGGAPKLARMTGCKHEKGDLECTHVAEAQQFIDNYYELYDKIRWWQYDRIKEVRRTGMVRGAWNFYRVLPQIFDDNKWAQLEAERMACNFPIQEGGARMMIRSLLAIHERWKGDLPLRAPFPGRIVFTVHDELNAQVRADLVEEGSAQMIEEMTKPCEQLKGWGLRVDPSVVDRWGG